MKAKTLLLFLIFFTSFLTTKSSCFDSYRAATLWFSDYQSTILATLTKENFIAPRIANIRKPTPAERIGSSILKNISPSSFLIKVSCSSILKGTLAGVSLGAITLFPKLSQFDKLTNTPLDYINLFKGTPPEASQFWTKDDIPFPLYATFAYKKNYYSVVPFLLLLGFATAQLEPNIPESSSKYHSLLTSIFKQLLDLKESLGLDYISRDTLIRKAKESLGVDLRDSQELCRACANISAIMNLLCPGDEVLLQKEVFEQKENIVKDLAKNIATILEKLPLLSRETSKKEQWKKNLERVETLLPRDGKRDDSLVSSSSTILSQISSDNEILIQTLKNFYSTLIKTWRSQNNFLMLPDIQDALGKLTDEWRSKRILALINEIDSNVEKDPSEEDLLRQLTILEKLVSQGPKKYDICGHYEPRSFYTKIKNLKRKSKYIGFSMFTPRPAVIRFNRDMKSPLCSFFDGTCEISWNEGLRSIEELTTPLHKHIQQLSSSRSLNFKQLREDLSTIEKRTSEIFHHLPFKTCELSQGFDAEQQDREEEESRLERYQNFQYKYIKAAQETLFQLPPLTSALLQSWNIYNSWTHALFNVSESLLNNKRTTDLSMLATERIFYFPFSHKNILFSPPTSDPWVFDRELLQLFNCKICDSHDEQGNIFSYYMVCL